MGIMHEDKRFRWLVGGLNNIHVASVFNVSDASGLAGRES
jgi:hypothetical protein